jgi:hypothetical protein
VDGSVVEVTDNLPLNAIRQLQVRSWAAEGQLPPGMLPDGAFVDPLDDSARHWIVQVGHVLAGAARLTIHTTGEDLPDLDQRQQEKGDG